VTVRIDRARASWFYNAGIDPRASALAPGIALELASIRDAIERGGRRHDLGPGAFAYKLELGGAVELRSDVRAASPSAIGQAVGRLEGAARRARERLPVRALARRARMRLAGR
jgi:CelD/BcsL family acetyltransferase involved in cellulose biosynthesis